jgi:hypothetical protein
MPESQGGRDKTPEYGLARGLIHMNVCDGGMPDCPVPGAQEYKQTLALYPEQLHRKRDGEIVLELWSAHGRDGLHHEWSL